MKRSCTKKEFKQPYHRMTMQIFQAMGYAM